MRLIVEPRARNIEPEVLMESLFRLSDLETRFPVNMNVLNAAGAPVVMGLKACLRAFLDHRREVRVRRSSFRLAKIEARLHILAGLLIVFLNLDEVIRIVRFEDEPKAKLIAAFALDDIQAEAILNTRLRQLARLEEMTLRPSTTSSPPSATACAPCWPPKPSSGAPSPASCARSRRCWGRGPRSAPAARPSRRPR